MEKHLHIISLDVPYPANYGGVYDLFYKLPALQQQGVKIHLHCFTKERAEQQALLNYCASVDYYPRNTGHKGLSLQLPYIVSSRTSNELINNLLKDDYPIFMEGVHCTALLQDKRFKQRRKFVRLHNVEHRYYRRLYECAKNPVNKMYYLWESRNLQKYEQAMVHKATAFWTVTQQDTAYFREQLHCNTVDYLPLFLPPWKVAEQEGFGTYCLYHGDLGVEANARAAEWLLDHVFSKTDIPFVIAGKNPSEALVHKAHAKMHTCLVADPSEAEMQDMIAKAQLHILPSFNDTGIQIKLLNVLYNGRHCLVNETMVAGNGLAPLCHIASGADEFIRYTEQLFLREYTNADVAERSELLGHMFNNAAGAQQMVHWIWTQYA